MTRDEANSRDIVIVQTLIADYRRAFWAALRGSISRDMRLFGGLSDFSESMRPDPLTPFEDARNHWILGRRFLWQSGSLLPAFRAQTTLLTLNPRVLSTWVVLVVRRLARRRTILWGHAWPREGRASRTDPVRQVMRRLADTLIVYTESEASELRAAMPGHDIVAAPNAIYYAREITPAPIPADGSTDFLYVGRLVSAKKPSLLLDAFVAALPRLSPDCRLVFVGDGDLAESLRETVAAYRLEDRVLFTGHRSEPDFLEEAHSRAIVSVSPGYAGLSLTQSLGFGVLMLIAADEPHAPEIAAARPGHNAWFFPSDDVSALADLLVQADRQRAELVSLRRMLSSEIRQTYSVEAMASTFGASLVGHSINVVR